MGKFSAENNFWVAHPLGKKPNHKDSVVCVRFDPLSGRVVASASLDGTIQITSCCPVGEEGVSAEGPFGGVTSYGTTLVTIPNNGWVNFVSWSPSCNVVAFGTQDCELNFATVTEAAGGKAKIKPTKIILSTNPLLGGVFVSESKFVGTGFDKVPFVYTQDGKDWKQTQCLDSGIKNVRAAKITNNKFKDQRVYFNPDFKLGSGIEMKETNTKHANYINCLKFFGGSQVLSTSDVNGYLNWWDVKNI